MNDVDWDAYYRERGELTASEEARERGRIKPRETKPNQISKKSKKRKGKKGKFRKGVVSAFGLSKARVRF